MKSGLEGRNNRWLGIIIIRRYSCLNEVRPRRPEQFVVAGAEPPGKPVSMKSGLEGRNNQPLKGFVVVCHDVSMKSGLEGRNNACWLAALIPSIA